jgi:antitoxin ChpS
MVAIPPVFLDQLSLSAKASVGVVIEEGRIIIQAATGRPRYNAADLIAQCDINAPAPEFDPEWANGEAVGDELI